MGDSSQSQATEGMISRAALVPPAPPQRRRAGARGDSAADLVRVPPDGSAACRGRHGRGPRDSRGGATALGGLFPVPAGFQPNVDFWLDVFARHSSDQVVLHDEALAEVVLSRLDFAALEDSGLSDLEQRRRREREVQDAQRRYREALDRLGDGRPAESNEERRIEVGFANRPGDRSRYREAADRLRVQTGLRDLISPPFPAPGSTWPRWKASSASGGCQWKRPCPSSSRCSRKGRAPRSAPAASGSSCRRRRGHTSRWIERDERYYPLRATEAAAAVLAENHAALELAARHHRVQLGQERDAEGRSRAGDERSGARSSAVTSCASSASRPASSTPSSWPRPRSTRTEPATFLASSRRLPSPTSISSPTGSWRSPTRRANRHASRRPAPPQPGLEHGRLGRPTDFPRDQILRAGWAVGGLPRRVRGAAGQSQADEQAATTRCAAATP